MTARTALAEAMTQAVVEASKVQGKAVDKEGEPLNVDEVKEGASHAWDVAKDRVGTSIVTV